MHKRFVDILVCPKTKQRLFLKSTKEKNNFIYSGFLFSQDGKRKYPIINGVPCFVVKENYLANFGYEWQKWPRIQFEENNESRPMKGHTSKMFRDITHFTSADLKGKLVIDYGCGPGRFIDIAKKMGAIVIGLDMSYAAFIARQNFQDDADVFIVQADLFNPPFKDDIFDFGYTIGTLHHTPNPKAGVKAIIKTIKPGGQLAVSVYSARGFYGYPSVYIYRRAINLISFLNKKVANKIALIYSLFSSFFLYYFILMVQKIPKYGDRISFFVGKYFFVCVMLPDINWRILDVFDAITPRYASTYKPEEVRSWLKSANCINIKQTDWADTSFVGVKK